jgi:CheY-like chemotaxis protein
MTTIEEVRPLLDEVRLAAQRSAALTNQLLAFARRQVVETQTIDPNALIRRLEPLLRRLLDERTRVEFELTAAGCVCIAESQLEQVLMNLVTNARDALPNGGRIKLETAELNLDAAPGRPVSGPSAGRYVIISVSDDGRGIAPEALPHLFEPFFTTREMGTGLGLATCYGIIKQAGGTITVESEDTRGSTFRVYLPRVENVEGAPEPRQTLPPSDARPKILVVEDEAPVRVVLDRTFRRGDFIVHVAERAEEALQIAEQHGPFDVLVSDIVMPGMDGTELARRLREKWPALRVLLISGYTHEFPLKDGRQDPNVGFLQKPFHPTELLDTVRKLCNRE